MFYKNIAKLDFFDFSYILGVVLVDNYLLVENGI